MPADRTDGKKSDRLFAGWNEPMPPVIDRMVNVSWVITLVLVVIFVIRWLFQASCLSVITPGCRDVPV